MHRRISLTRYLVEKQHNDGRIPPELRLLLEVVARACKRISFAVNKGDLGEVMGTAGSEGLEASRRQATFEATHHGTDFSAKFLAQILEHPHHKPFPA